MSRRIVQMSDELDALDELERDLRAPRKRKLSIVLPILVTLIVSAGATVIAWYSYNTGVREGSEVAAPLLKPQGPSKVAPESPGGLSIPHQDKTVFQAIEGKRSDMKVERLLPPPETPAQLPAQATPPVRPDASQVRQAERLESGGGEQPAPMNEGRTGPVRLTPDAGTKPPPPTVSRTAPPPPVTAKKPDTGAATVTMPTPSKPAAMPKPPAAETKPAVARAMPAPKTRIRPKFGYGVQIASLTSKTKASDFWDRQVKANKDLLDDLSLFVHTVTVKGKTYHRVQGGTFEGRAAAANLCAALKKRGVGCVVVHFGK